MPVSIDLDQFLLATAAIAAIGGAAAGLYHVFIRTKLLSQEERVRFDEFRYRLEEQLQALNRRLVESQEDAARINHLQMEASRALLSGPHAESDLFSPQSFLDGIGVDSKTLRIQKDLVFVLVPFHPNMQEVYSHISSACTKVGLSCRRGDEQFASGTILRQIVQQVLEARIVIAVLDARNPNVFYELGIAQAMGKQVLMVSRVDDPPPFDIAHQRILFYRHPSELEKELGAHLTRLALVGQDR